ncbi:MAG: hypothetical protein M1830_001232 [Pleopsidium flavum]|nr:MAG: hypothetical protein M1830_001232 [Pleopsidium flavum]
MALPSWAPFPPASLRKEIMPEEWEACLDAWISLSQAHLLLPGNVFSLKSTKDGALVSFLSSYFQEASRNPSLAFESAGSRTLRQQCFLLSHRLLTEVDVVPPSIDWAFLGNLSTVYAKRGALQALINATSLRKELDPGLQNLKKILVKELENSGPGVSPDLDDSLRRLCALMHASPNIGHFFMIGSDFLDALASSYGTAPSDLQKKLVTISYLGLTSLTEGDKPNVSLLIDHLYSLKSSAEVKPKIGQTQTSLASSLVTDTPLLRKLQDRVKGAEASRLRPVIAALEAFRNSSVTKKKRLVRRKIDKGKARDHDEYGHGSFNGIHVHRMSLVTQVQDLFPDLGSGFIVKLLDEYDDDVEQVTAHLLEDSLPARLREANRTEDIHHTNTNTTTTKDLAPHLAPHPTPSLLPTRPNTLSSSNNNNTDLTTLSLPPTHLHIGRANPTLTADTLLSTPPTAPNKAAILSALAAFDSDDDERDDTYDASDVGGTVDSTMPAIDNNNVDTDLREDGDNEEALFAAYKLSPEVFGRDAVTRRGKARAALKSDTSMTDEAIEGWGLMLGRDARRMRRLEARFGMFGGVQRELGTTAWRGGSGGEDSDIGGRGRGGSRERGGRGGGGRRGANVAGPADNKGTQIARQRKDANKGSRANHNRRDQRARKMARGGSAG